METPFYPTLTELGKRHPVTRGLEGADQNPPPWSRWFRLVDARAEKGVPVMQGPEERPLLLLSREGEGRVALLLSDHIWLWARGYEGGGPHLDLLRRLSHWLMKQPDLEEEALRLGIRGRDLEVRRQSMAEEVAQVTIDDAERTDAHAHPRQERARRVEGDHAGERAWPVARHDGKLTALVNVGPANPREYAEVTSTTQRAEPAHQRDRGRHAPPRGCERKRHDPARPRRAFQRDLQGRRLDRPQDARGERRARHRRSAAVRRHARAAAADRLASPRRGHARAADAVPWIAKTARASY